MTKNTKSQLWKHLAALIYDIFPILGIFLATSLLMVVLRGGKEISPQTIWFQLLLVGEVYLYFAYSWLKGGQTLGMRAWKIGIQEHHKLNWTQVSKRFITGLVSSLLLGLGLWSRLWDKNQLSWMDKACGKPVINVSGEPLIKS